MLEFSDILNLTELGRTVMHNRTTDADGAVVNWLKIKWLRFQKSKPCTIQFKYELQNELSFKELDVSLNRSTPLSWDSVTIPPKYQSIIPVSKAKKKDLLSLLKTGVIPKCYEDFIMKIPSSEEAKDLVPYLVENEDEDPLPKRRSATQPTSEVVKTRSRSNNGKKKETNGKQSKKEISMINEEKKKDSDKKKASGEKKRQEINGLIEDRKKPKSKKKQKDDEKKTKETGVQKK